MRLAFLSDIHGNPIALDAVLADIQAQGGADTYWVLGDLVAIGPDPVGTLQRLVRLPNVRFARGNTDRYVVTRDRLESALADVRADPGLLPNLVGLEQSLSWTQGAVTAAGWLDWLAALPLELRMTLPDGTRLLGVHASPGTDDGVGMRPTMSDAELAALLTGCEADLVCVGHTHWPQDRTVNSVRMVNLGSVSNPLPPDLRASYALLEAHASGYHLQHRRVDYDREAVIELTQKVRHPPAGYIARFMLGQRLPEWDKPHA